MEEKQLTPAPINEETKLAGFIDEMTLCDYIKKVDYRVRTYTYWVYNCLCLLSYAIDDNWMHLEIVQGEDKDRNDVIKALEQWMEPTNPMYIVQPDTSQPNTYRFYFAEGWENLTPAPIDEKNVVSDFTEAFHNGEYMERTDGKIHFEYFILHDCLCVVHYTFGHHRFVVGPVEGDSNLKELCRKDIRRMVDAMNGINKSQGIWVKTFADGCYGFYFSPETLE